MANGRYTPDAGTVEAAPCDVCGQDMQVERNVVGPRTSAGAMAGIKSKYDSFTCKDKDEQWHEAIAHMQETLRHTVSPTLRKILKQDIADIRKSRKYDEGIYVSRFT